MLTPKQQARDVLDSIELAARTADGLVQFEVLSILPKLSLDALQLAIRKLMSQVHEAQSTLTIHVIDEEDTTDDIDD